jgi:hypothetical protein
MIMAKAKYDWHWRKAEEQDRSAVRIMLDVARQYTPSIDQFDLAVVFKPQGRPGVTVPSGPWAELSEAQACIVLPWESWQKWSEDQKRAELHALLVRLLPKEKTDGLLVIPPDVAFSLSVLLAHGPVGEFQKQVVKAIKALKLPGLEDGMETAKVEAAVNKTPAAPAEPGASNGEAIEALAADPAFMRAARDMCPKRGDVSVTVSMPSTGKSVVLTSATRKEIDARLKAAKESEPVPAGAE